MTQDFNKKVIARIAKEKLKSGKSKQDVYEELVSEFNHRGDIAQIIAPLPSASKWKKYGIWNTVFLVLLILLLLFLLLMPNLSLIWTSWLIYITATKKFKYYYWSTIAGVLGLVSIISIAVYYGTISGAMLVLTILLSLIFVSAGIFLPIFLKPTITESRESYVNSEGKTEIVIKHIFSE